MGKARTRKREQLRLEGKLYRKDSVQEEGVKSTENHDIKELIPVMEKLGMNRGEKSKFQFAICTCLSLSLLEVNEDQRERAFDLVDVLPLQHRDAAYQFIVNFLERKLAS